MALKDTINTLNKLLSLLIKDLEKACRGNKAASQRVRTGSIKLEKAAKIYRKESVAAEKKGIFDKMKKECKASSTKTKKAPKKAPKKVAKKGKRKK